MRRRMNRLLLANLVGFALLGLWTYGGWSGRG